MQLMFVKAKPVFGLAWPVGNASLPLCRNALPVLYMAELTF